MINTHAHDARTPPRGAVSHIMMARKRDRPTADAASLSLDGGVVVGNCAPPLLHRGHNANSNMANTTPTSSSSLFPPSPHHHNYDHSAATVSPFVDRMPSSLTARSKNSLFTSPLLKLEPVPEEEFNFSQSTIDSESSGNSNAAMIGTMVGDADESSVGFHSHEEQCCPPPTKRARLDYNDDGPHVLSQSMEEDAAMDVMDHSPKKIKQDHCFMKQKMGWNVNSKIRNIDKPHDDGSCCHVCSLDASANSGSKYASIASTTASLNKAHQGHNGVNNAGVPASPAPPRSHSLLTYFQRSTTKKQPAAAAFSQHHPTSKAPSLNNNHNNVSSLNPCRYCDKPTCITCTKTCEQCHYMFCTFCTKVDYESSVVERILCFECDGDMAIRNNGDCDMMDL